MTRSTAHAPARASLALATLLLALPGAAASEGPEALSGTTLRPEGLPVEAGYDDGWFVETLDGNYRIELETRLQLRFAYPFDDVPDTAAELDAASESAGGLDIQRARIKVGGHGYRPWIGYYFEHDLPSNRLLDWRLTLAPSDAIGLRLGQWKVEFTRERFVSSGKQQLAERSIVNEYFTVDRQVGAELRGRPFAGAPWDLTYLVGAFDGDGRGSGNEDDHWMGFARLQWNVLGRQVAATQSDLARTPDPALSVAVAGVTNRSRYTAFSSAGGGQLPGFEDDGTDRYRLRQWMSDLAFRYRGFSVDHEFHRKEIRDRGTGTTTLQGAYAQAGLFPSALWSAVPPPLELAFRYAFVDPDVDRAGDTRSEWTVGANWFFWGHRNKITLDASILTIDDPEGPDADGRRVRLQWDVSI